MIPGLDRCDAGHESKQHRPAGSAILADSGCTGERTNLPGLETRVRGIEQIPWLYDAGMWLCDALGLGGWRERLVRGVRGRVLEVGCGTGRNLPRYPQGAEVIGIDPDLAALRRARGRAPEVPLVAARAEALPFRADAFEVVVSSLTFCSVDDPQRGLAEVRRVLKPEGELRMLEHVRARGARWARLQDRAQPLWTRVTGGCRPNRATEAAVQAAGFEIDAAGESRGLLRRFSARARREETGAKS
jgi:SAM-dependent methyltransferase